MDGRRPGAYSAGRDHNGREAGIGSRAARGGLATLIASALAFAAVPAAEAARVSPPLQRLVGALGGDSARAGARRYDDLRKISGGLADLGARQVDGQDVTAAADAAEVEVNRAGQALVDVYVRKPAAAAARALAATGMRVTGATDAAPMGMVEGYLPLGAVGRAAGIDTVRAVAPVQGGGVDLSGARSKADEFGPGPGSDIGSVTSGGVGAHNLAAAQAAGGTTGAGISVGVISDSINHVAGGVATSQGTGDLPPNPQVVVLKDDTSATVIDEGRAMAEIVYDEAPGLARILFASGTGSGAVKTGAVGKADSISQLVANGAQVIADDIFYLSEPFFQDGVVSQAVDAAKAAGVPYFASAGNRGRQGWEGTFSPAGADHDFDPGPGVDTRQAVRTLATGQSVSINLQWAEPLGAVATDIDIRLRRVGDDAVLDSSTDSNVSSGRPSESVSYTNPGASIQVALQITRAAGGAAPFMKYIARSSSQPFTVAEFPTNSDTINPDAAAARGSLAVAAVNAADPGHNTPEGFSSRGPKVRLFSTVGAALPAPEVRAKPNLAAADAVATTVPGFTTFSGTSASAPSAAGIAALLRSAKPVMPVDLVYALMTEPASAIPCAAAAGSTPASDCGAGFLLADQAMARTLDATPPTVSAILTPNVPTGTNGWFRGNVGVAWALADPGSPVVPTGGCVATTVAADGQAAQACTAASAGGPATASITIRRDATPPAVPVLKGIKARTYARSAVPKSSKVTCVSSDATSGLADCEVRGLTRSLGRRKVTALATDNAGNTATATLSYRVVKDPAKARLASAKVKGGKVTAAFTVPGKGTLAVVLTRKSGRRTVTLATGRASPRRKGKVTVTLKLAAAGRRALGRRGARVRATLTAAFKDPATLGSSRLAATRTLVAK